jgi:hypothetical protein
MMINRQSRSIFSFLLLAALAANAQAATTSLSVNFQTQSTHAIPQDAANTAGVVPASFWNNSGADGLTSARLSDGTSHAIDVSMNANEIHPQIATPNNNDERLMGDSFDLHGGTLTLFGSNLPTVFTSQGYDVYLYHRGTDNPNQQGVYQVEYNPSQGSVPSAFFQQTISSFNGFDNSGQSDSQGSAGQADYVKIARVGQGQDSFEIEITNIAGVNPDEWTVINGFQVVAVPEPTIGLFSGLRRCWHGSATSPRNVVGGPSGEQITTKLAPSARLAIPFLAASLVFSSNSSNFI